MHEQLQSMTTAPANAIRGEITVPGDKSISHRSIMLGSLAGGTTRITNFLRGEDNFSTMGAFRAMGVPIEDDGQTVTVHGVGLHGLKEPGDLLDCGNSGTTIRLMTGLLSGQSFFSVLTGDQYLRKRPMKRVTEPLRRMGALIAGRGNGTLAPLAITGSVLSGICYDSPIASAQVKSSLMLAGLYAHGETSITEPTLSRDHSERMFRYFGANLATSGTTVTLRGGQELQGREINVPGDISSAAFFLVAALVVPGSELLICNVGVNPTRTGVIDILQAMGGDIVLQNQREVSGEPVADLLVRSSRLKGIEIGGDVVPRAIDEFPVICVAAALAEGITTLRDARELRVKETDRIAAIAAGLRTMGSGQIVETDDGMVIEGVEKLQGGMGQSFGDHRIAMSLSVAALACRSQVTVDDVACVATSFPGFFELLNKVALR
jgi:3-phosphoshikimate 1-carboxyvinyltransferase